MSDQFDKINPGDTVLLSREVRGVKVTVTFEVARVKRDNVGDVLLYVKGGSKTDAYVMHTGIDDAWDNYRWFLNEHIQAPMQEPVHTWAVVKMTTPSGYERFFVKTPNGKWLATANGMFYEWDKVYNDAVGRDTIEVIRD